MLVVLTVGVWALVLEPDLLKAHDDNWHSCYFQFSSGSGETDGSYVWLYEVIGYVDCNH